MKKLCYYLITFLAVLFLPLFFSGNSFADSPSYTLSEVPSGTVVLCHEYNPSLSVLSIKCSDYSYVNAEITGTASVRLQIYSSGNTDINLNSRVLSTLSVKLSSVEAVQVVPTNANFSSGSSITFSFSDTPIGSAGSVVPSGSLTITENGTYDVTNYAEAVVYVPEGECEDCDTPFIVSLFKDSFWGIITACVSLIVPILALFLIFRLVHDWLWGKG